MRNREREISAQMAAAYIRDRVPVDFKPRVGLILGTGWGDVLQLEKAVAISFSVVPGFSALTDLPGHARQLVAGELAGKQVVVLRGRVHMNEAPSDPEIAKMVRLQTEMLMQLGVQQLIVTSAVGAVGTVLQVGSVGVVDGFVTLFAPEMPLWGGEFCSPEDALSERLRTVALEEQGDLHLTAAGHAMVRGPFFEGRTYDKQTWLAAGADMVGMSLLPEACVAALYEGVEVLGLGFVTNDDVAAHSHEVNLRRAQVSSVQLGELLTRIVSRL
ncbi:MAG: purine-nucleoside phosphorylase [Candidatus Magasanikbacteria bacterium]|nr:purine-nucleoside phosphorylase [Candidatus Magasanikbacteria bacterium]